MLSYIDQILREDFFLKISKTKESTVIVGIIEIQNIIDLLIYFDADINNLLLKHISNEINAAGLQLETCILQISIGKFCVVIPSNQADVKNDMQKFKKALHAVTNIMHHDSNKLLLSCRAGCSFGKKDNVLYLMQIAYLALNSAINCNPSKMLVIADDTCAETQAARNRIRMATELLIAIENGRTCIAYQPVICSVTGAIRNYECLLRIQNEDDIISAGPFIGASEEVGTIYHIDSLMLEIVVNELKTYPNIILGMNISNLSVDNEQWLQKAKVLLSDPDIAQRLTIEITETGNLRDLAKMAKFVDELKGIGCKVAIDDFGAGYTSFHQLKFLHADIIKIDGAFVRNIADNVDNQLFVKTLVSFAKGFGISTVAEFVEDGRIAKILMEIGIDYMQGHYFSPAVNYKPWTIKENPAFI